MFTEHFLAVYDPEREGKPAEGMQHGVIPHALDVVGLRRRWGRVVLIRRLGVQQGGLNSDENAGE